MYAVEIQLSRWGWFFYYVHCWFYMANQLSQGLLGYDYQNMYNIENSIEGKRKTPFCKVTKTGIPRYTIFHTESVSQTFVKETIQNRQDQIESYLCGCLESQLDWTSAVVFLVASFVNLYN